MFVFGFNHTHTNYGHEIFLSFELFFCFLRLGFFSIENLSTYAVLFHRKLIGQKKIIFSLLMIFILFFHLLFFLENQILLGSVAGLIKMFTRQNRSHAKR